MTANIMTLTRGFTTDAVRSFAVSENKTPFEITKRKWARAITSSRISRFLSGASKMCAFCAMAVCLMLQSHILFPDQLDNMQTGSHILAITAVAICLLRVVPVIVEGVKHIQTARTHHSNTQNTISRIGKKIGDLARLGNLASRGAAVLKTPFQRQRGLDSRFEGFR